MSASHEEPHRPAAYRAVLLRSNGSVLESRKLSAVSDDEALVQAKALIDGHAVELWDGLRFIEHYRAINQG